MAKPRPTVKAAIVCDQAIKEAGSNKWTLVGIFNQIYAQLDEAAEKAALEQMRAAIAKLKAEGKPAPEARLTIAHSQMGVYFCMGNAEGPYAFEIHFVKYENADEILIAKLPGGFEATNRLLTSEFAINLKNVQLPGFGRYAIKLFIDGEFVGDKVIDLIRLKPGAK